MPKKLEQLPSTETSDILAVMSGKREKITSYIISVLAVTAFVVITFYTLVWASGIKYDITTGTIERTSVISIEATLKNVSVLLNGQQIGTETPLDQRSLTAGRYELVISKPGFVTIDKVFNLQSDQVGVLSSAVELLAQNPTVEKNVSGLLYRPADAYDVGLSVKQGEIIDNGALITRLSSSPSQVHRYNSGYIYQINNQLRLYVPETNQDVLVYQLASADLAKLSLDESNWQVSIFSTATMADVVHLLEPNATSASSG